MAWFNFFTILLDVWSEGKGSPFPYPPPSTIYQSPDVALAGLDKGNPASHVHVAGRRGRLVALREKRAPFRLHDTPRLDERLLGW